MKTYKDLSRLNTFEERFEYLRLNAEVGRDTFGFERYINQQFYKSQEWLKVRSQVIIRDQGCDLGIEERPINGRVIIHHINPISQNDLIERDSKIFDPENLICVTHETHNAIHYGNSKTLPNNTVIERRPGDTCPWKQSSCIMA